VSGALLYDDVLQNWQRSAVDAWERGDGTAPYRGTLEVFTGGGKTLMALAAYQLQRRDDPSLRLAVVVPSAALQGQWIESVRRWLALPPESLGRLGDGGDDSFADKQVLIAVINTAADRLPGLAESFKLMLVVDECHRAGAPQFSRVLDTPATMKLGLSATPERVETDEHGLPIAFDEQIVAKRLGRVVHRYTLKDARRSGWLPTYHLVHHGVALAAEERGEYERLSRRISDLQEQLSDLGITGGALARVTRQTGGQGGELLSALRGLTGRRKDLLYRSTERRRVAELIVHQARDADADARVLLFHERVAEAEALFTLIRQRSQNPADVVLEHSQLPTVRRREAIERFRTGASPVLVSVKSLVEGLDVPEASVGVSVAASASVRQRIQTLGRVLRRDFSDNPLKVVVQMHLLYVSDTVDEAIYAGEDWEDLTGRDSNRYLSWAFGVDEPTSEPGPPRTPRLTEEQAHVEIQEAGQFPLPWRSTLPAQEYSVSTVGSVTTEDGTMVANPQGVSDMVESVRGQPGGRFRVSDNYLYVVVGHRGGSGHEPGLYVAGRLREHFRAVGLDREGGPDVELAALAPGDVLPIQPNKGGGSYKLRATRGGVIERRQGRIAEFAIDEGHDESARLAASILERWRDLGLPGTTFHVSDDGVAWYASSQGPAFLAEMTCALRFPSDGEPSQNEGTEDGVG
jgi:superfamily II DNA or RNA helicase